MPRKEKHYTYLEDVQCDARTDSKKHHEVKALLQSWIKASKSYVHTLQKVQELTDSPWWYNERANIGVLAGAAWKNKWVALEEYRSRKRIATALGSGPSAEKDNRGGRNDLFICAEHYSYVFEAKHVWQHVGTPTQPNLNKLGSARNAAIADIRKLFEEEADCYFAATFVVPYLPTRSISVNGQINAEALKKRIEAWLTAFHNEISPAERHLDYAYLFPIPTTRDKHFVSVNGKYCYPGVLLILDEI